MTDRYPDMELLTCKRLWPHLEKGEGHFVALLRKHSVTENDVNDDAKRSTSKRRNKNNPKINSSVRDAYQLFQDWASLELPGFSYQGVLCCSENPYIYCLNPLMATSILGCWMVCVFLVPGYILPI